MGSAGSAADSFLFTSRNAHQHPTNQEKDLRHSNSDSGIIRRDNSYETKSTSVTEVPTNNRNEMIKKCEVSGQ